MCLGQLILSGVRLLTFRCRLFIRTNGEGLAEGPADAIKVLNSEFRAYIEDARAWLEQRQGALQEEYPLARSRFAGADQSTGTLKFTFDGEEDLVLAQRTS